MTQIRAVWFDGANMKLLMFQARFFDFRDPTLPRTEDGSESTANGTAGSPDAPATTVFVHAEAGDEARSAELLAASD